jgi:transcriptional regulator with XRE-family HTH domain
MAQGVPARPRAAISSTLGQLIREERKHRGWTQEQLGDHLGVRRQTINGWENGGQVPDQRYYRQIANFLGLSTERSIAILASSTVISSFGFRAAEAILSQLERDPTPSDGLIQAFRELIALARELGQPSVFSLTADE